MPAVTLSGMIRRLCLLLCIALIAPVYADDPELPERADTEAGELLRCANVPMRIWGLFKVGDAGLYLPECGMYDQVGTDIPQQYSVLLSRDADGKRLGDMAMDVLEDNYPEDELAQLEPLFRCITESYADSPEGNRVDVRYLPGIGLRLLEEGELLAECEGGPEAAGYFRVWFGEDPFNDKLKQELLKQAQENAVNTDESTP